MTPLSSERNPREITNFLDCRTVRADATCEEVAEKIEGLKKTGMIGMTTIPNQNGRMMPVYIFKSPVNYKHNKHLVMDYREGINKYGPTIIRADHQLDNCPACDASWFSVVSAETSEELGFAKVLPFLKKNDFFTSYWGINQSKFIEAPKKYRRYGWTVDKVVVESLICRDKQAVCRALIRGIMEHYQASCGTKMLVNDLTKSSGEFTALTNMGFEDASYSPVESEQRAVNDQALYIPLDSTASAQWTRDIQEEYILFPDSPLKAMREMQEALGRMKQPHKKE